MNDQKHYSDLNLEDIGKLSGVSRSTVSRVINNHPNVSENTRQRVMKVIEQYHFQPNAAARALASQKSNVIGVLIPHIVSDVFSDPFFPTLLQSITNTASQLDYNVTLWLANSNDGKSILNRVVTNRLLDGLIVASAVVDRAFLDALAAYNKPFILVGHPAAADTSVSFVDGENHEGAFMMVSHMIERGYRRIGFIPGLIELTSSQDRLRGYQDALVNAGFVSDNALVGPAGNYTEAGGYHAMRALLDQSVDAVFCASDLMALGAIRAINEAGLRIPDDIAVGGFDDISLAGQTIPPLTTVHQSIDGLGSSAAAGIIGVIEGRLTEPYQLIQPVNLVVRQST